MGRENSGHTFLFLQLTHDNRVLLSDEGWVVRPSGGDVVSMGVLMMVVVPFCTNKSP
jgi:hypothetical protein